MNVQQRIKKFNRACARHSLFFMSSLVTKMPYRVVNFISRLLIAFGYAVAVKQRRIAHESLRIAFGQDKSEEEIDKISAECFDHLGQGMIELIYYMEHPAMIGERVRFENQDILKRAFSQGKGVVAVSAHFGNFPLMLVRLAQEGYATNAIIRAARDEIAEKRFLEQRSRLGIKTIYYKPRVQCVQEAIKALRHNELVFIPLDQNFGSGGGVYVDFFGQQAATATGPVVFALRTGAPIVPIFSVSDEREGHHRIIVEDPVELVIKEDDKETIRENTQKLTNIIERYIRRYPSEWGWMHRRWKTQPLEDQKHKE